MFNPFAIFEPHFLSGFRQKGVQAFVQQTYDRGKIPLDPRPAYLLTHFNRLDWAREHYDVLQHDANRKVFVLELPSDLQALKTALTSKSALYYTILTMKDANGKAKKALAKQISSFIKQNTNWQPSDYKEISLDLEVTFGDIFVKLFYNNQQVKEKLDRLDSLKQYVL
jgi:hypothetical protein